MNVVVNQTLIFFNFIKDTRSLMRLFKILCSFIFLLVFCNIICIHYNLHQPILDPGISYKLYHFIAVGSDNRLADYILRGFYFSTSLLILVIFLTEGKGIYLFFSVLNIFIWVSTTFGYHAKVAMIIKQYFEANIFINGEFEIFAWLIMFFIFLPFFIKCICNVKIEDIGIITLLLLSFILLCFFAIFIDYMSELLIVYFGFYSIVLSLVEEGGELIVGSITFIIALSALLIKSQNWKRLN